MSDELNKLTGTIGDTLKTAPTIYEDALQPTVQEVGKFAARIPRAINAVFSCLDRWILNKEYAIDETKKLLEQKLENINPEKIIEPEPYVAIPAIQAISYSINSKELRDLYANLLSKSMNSDVKDTVHPSYIEIIKQLSPDDAAYFKYICSLEVRPLMDVLLHFNDSLSLKLVKNQNLFSSEHVKNFELAFDNLSRLGLINIPYNVVYGDDSVYNELSDILNKNYTLEKLKPLHPYATKVTFHKKRIDITPYGQNFYNICCI